MAVWSGASWKPRYEGGMLIPHAVEKICSEGQALKFEAGFYEVLDGPLFEQRFNELRRCSTHRPFSRMFRHYTLMEGDGWARKGTRFVAVSKVKSFCVQGRNEGELERA